MTSENVSANSLEIRKLIEKNRSLPPPSQLDVDWGLIRVVHCEMLWNYPEHTIEQIEQTVRSFVLLFGRWPEGERPSWV